MQIKMQNKQFLTSMGQIQYWRNDLKADRPTLVFLPGLTADHRLFQKQIEYFQDAYNILVWDAPGHGASRPFVLEYSLMDQARWLHQILESELVAMPILIGHSMGGYLTQCYLELFADEVKAFVSIGSSSLQLKYATKKELWFMRQVRSIYSFYPWQSLKKLGAKLCSTTEYGRKLNELFLESYTKEEYCNLAGHGLRTLADAIEADLAYEIKCPTLLLCGDHDKTGLMRRNNAKWAKDTGFELIWLENAAHNANTDNPEQTNSAIEQFVASLQ